MSNASTPFRPFETNFDLNQALNTLKDTVYGADDGEMFLERQRSEALLLDDGRIKTANYNASEGFGLRAVNGETVGYAHSTEMTQSALNRAAETAKLAIGSGGGKLADPPIPTNQRLYSDIDPISDTEFGLKIETLKEIDSFARELNNKVVQVSASLVASLQEVEILRPEGTLVRDVRPMARINISITVEHNGRRESGSSGGGGRHGLVQLTRPENWKPNVIEAIRIAMVNLNAIPAPAGQFDVVLGPGWPGILLHEAIGHGLEGDFNRKGSSVFSGKIGQKVTSTLCTIVDDGTLKDLRGSLNVDDEGVNGQYNTLIENGVLKRVFTDKKNYYLKGTKDITEPYRPIDKLGPFVPITPVY